MNKQIFFIIFLSLHTCIFAQNGDIWSIQEDGSIKWTIEKGNIPHDDHLEMSGQMLSVVLRYGVDPEGAFHLNRSLIFPMLRLKPNKTHDNLKQRFDISIPALITVEDKSLTNEKVNNISFNGTLKVESLFSYISGRNQVKDGIKMTRLLYPSTLSPFYCEEYTLENREERPVKIRIPEWKITYSTPDSAGIYGAYRVETMLSKNGIFTLNPGEKLEFYALFSGRKINESPYHSINIVQEREARKKLLEQWNHNLVLTTPNPVLNSMFAFAKIRGAESIYRTKGGLMHGPGGESYYAAIWANDQAEYINPFFPYLGYEIANESALNSFRHFARFMNPDYKPIPSSIISEGVGTWHGAKDRGDGAMIAYGAARYALARGNRAEAMELWPLIEWCLEFCHRKLTPSGVVASDSDELENRFPAGDANLTTSCLYFDALNSAALLGKELGVNVSKLKTYDQQAKALEKAIEKHFGYEIEGFHSYRYYEGNEILRSWICMPLTVGIYTRAKGTVDALFSPRLWTDNGLLTQAGTETFWDRSTLYALRGTIAAGEVEKGINFLKKYSRKRLLGDHVPYAIEAWPEGEQRHLSAESGLYCRIYTEGLFGIRPTGLRKFDMTPRLPQDWDYMNLENIKAHESKFSIFVKRVDDNFLDVNVTKNNEQPVFKKRIKEGEKITIHL
jgi:hypothetical protein